MSRGAGDVIPNLVGMDKSEAQSTIKKYGFKVGDIKEADSSKTKDTVIKQDPTAGSEAETGDTINLTVSNGKGKQQVSVPDMLGDSRTAAENELSSVGLKVGNVTYGSSSSYSSGQVMSQQYSAGVKIDKGSTVDIKISKGGGSGSVNLYVDFSSATSDVFYLTITVSDDNGTRSPVSGVQKKKSEGGESYDIKGTGSGTITVLFDGKTVKRYNVDFSTGDMS